MWLSQEPIRDCHVEQATPKSIYKECFLSASEHDVRMARRRQGIYWLLTVPEHCFTPYLPPCCVWIKGQLEKGSETGYLHWQICCAFSKKASLKTCQSTFGTGCHFELTRSSAAGDYVWKDDTAVVGTRFEFGEP